MKPYLVKCHFITEYFTYFILNFYARFLLSFSLKVNEKTETEIAADKSRTIIENEKEGSFRQNGVIFSF